MTKWPAAPAGRIAYVNGRYLPHGRAMVHVEDRALQFGDGVYEVMALVCGLPVDEDAHLDRLERSLGEIGIAMPMGRPALKSVLREVAARNHARDGILYLQVTRGAARRDHVPPTDGPRPTLILTFQRQDRAALAARLEKGVAVVTRPDERWARRDIKTVQLLPNLLAKQAARAAGAHEAWLVDAQGFVTEGASTNAWIVDGAGAAVTRDLSHAILPGVTRRVLMAALAEAGVPVEERKFTVAEAQGAREAFITSATGPLIPVVAIDGVPVGNGEPGPLTARLRALYMRKAGIPS